MDKFSKWLEEHKDHDALIDKSYKKVSQNKEKSADTKDIKVNTELATYGDAVLKLALCQILWAEEVKQLTEKKKKYESDEVLVNTIAKHYDMLKYIKYDNEDEKMPKDYCYERDKHKFIATAVEACLGAIYEEKKDMNKVIETVKVWKNIIDEDNSK